MFNKATMYQMIQWAIDAASPMPAHVVVTGSAEGLTRFANSEIHQNVFEDKTNLQVILFGSKKKSSVTTNKITKEGIEAAVREAKENLGFLPEGEELPGLVSEPARIELDRFDQSLADEFPAEARALRLAEQLQHVELPYKAYGQLSYSEDSIAIGNSTGIRRYYLGNNVNCSVLISHENGAAGYAAGVGNTKGELPLEALFETAYQKAKANQNPVTLPIGAYTVILEPQAVFNLMMYTTLLGFSAKSIQQKMSFLTDRMGEKIFDEKITIRDDWENPNSLGLPFDMEGTPRSKLTLIEKGVAKEVAYDTETAAKENKRSTGHSVGMGFFAGAIPINLVMEPGKKSLKEIIAETEEGLLVTRFHYMNPVNPRQALLTGLTRDGFFKIEKGQIVGAISNMRMTESMLKAFNQVEEISQDCQRISAFLGNVHVPAMKIKDFHFTGQTGMKEPGKS